MVLGLPLLKVIGALAIAFLIAIQGPDDFGCGKIEKDSTVNWAWCPDHPDQTTAPITSLPETFHESETQDVKEE